jgi:hypothetical protein
MNEKKCNWCRNPEVVPGFNLCLKCKGKYDSDTIYENAVKYSNNKVIQGYYDSHSHEKRFSNNYTKL